MVSATPTATGDTATVPEMVRTKLTGLGESQAADFKAVAEAFGLKNICPEDQHLYLCASENSDGPDTKREIVPRVGMACINTSGDNFGIITKVVVGETKQPYVHYRDIQTGDIDTQFFHGILLPFKSTMLPTTPKPTPKITTQDAGEAKRCSPVVGMFIVDTMRYDQAGIITQLFTENAEEAFCVYEDIESGKLNTQFLKDILTPFENTVAASATVPLPVIPQRQENPFLSLYREFSDLEDRFLALYKRLSSPNEPVEDVSDTASELRFQIDVAITGWERDIKYGTLRPVETDGASDDQMDHKSAV